jgi:hypothetical protein
MTTSGETDCPAATAASMAVRGTSTTASENTVTSRPDSDSLTVAKPGVPAMTGSVMTSTRCP